MTDNTIQERSLARIRMKYAYEYLKNRTSGDEIKTRLKGLPVEMRMNGLAVVGAKLCASTEYKEKIIGKMLAEWLLEKCPSSPFKTKTSLEQQNNPLKQLLDLCIKANRFEYEAAQVEALTFLEQAKLIAEALWPEGS